MYPPHHLGGYELVWRSSVQHLREAGHEVRVLASDHREGDGGDEDADVHRDLRWYWRDHDIPRPSARERLAIERHNAAVLDRHLAELRPELVSWWAMGGMSLSLVGRVRSAEVPACAVVLDDWLLYAPDVDAWTRWFAPRPRLGRLAQAVTGIPARFDPVAIGPALFPSAVTRDRATAVHRLAGDAVHPPGIDRGLFRPAPERPWTWRLLYAGRIDPRKGIDRAIRALAELPGQATLAIDGDGDRAHREELAALTATKGVEARVEFRRSAREALPAAYAEASAVVFPVLWEEPWGLVPLEAMACGTPVVASGRGGSGEYLRDGENCLLFDPDAGAAALAGVLRRLADEPDLRARLRAGGIETAAAHDEGEWNRAVAEHCERAAARPLNSAPG